MLLYRIRRCVSWLRFRVLYTAAPLIVEGWYEGFWDFRKRLRAKVNVGKGVKLRRVYNNYTKRWCATIGLGAEFASIPTFPHGLNGVFISNSAKIGKNVVIFHHVTIGSNTLPDSKSQGAPVIEDGVFIGAGAKIIGNVTIGRNSRIGAGCVVTSDVPANSIVVSQKPRVITRDYELNNRFIANLWQEK